MIVIVTAPDAEALRWLIAWIEQHQLATVVHTPGATTIELHADRAREYVLTITADAYRCAAQVDEPGRAAQEQSHNGK